MKNLLKNIWDAPAATAAASVIAAIGVFIAADIALPKWTVVSLAAIAAALALFSGPNPKK